LYQIPTEYQLADLLTKLLQLGPFERCLYSLLVEDPQRRDDRDYLEGYGTSASEGGEIDL
jgi:hypothetical protein